MDRSRHHDESSLFPPPPSLALWVGSEAPLDDSAIVTAWPGHLRDNPTLSLNPARASLVFKDVARAAEAHDDAPLPLVEESPFPLVSLIARGGHGEVWEGEQDGLARVVAVKRIRPDLLARADEATERLLTEQFRAEATITARLEHPNIVPVHELRRDATGRPLLAMKLVRGTDWSTRLRTDFEALPAAEVVARHVPILVQVCHAVAFAHERGVVHRDLKPSQVMLGEHGEVLLMDWGLAFVAHDHPTLAGPSDSFRGGLPTLATATNPSGTPAYMAPEQTSMDAAALGPWTDTFLLGGILYEILTGVPPHHAKSAPQAFSLARQAAPPAPHRRAPDRDIPAELEAICLRAMARDPIERFPTVEALRAALDDYLNGTSRRRESVALVQRASEALARTASDYRHLSEIAADLTRALVLWPDNRAADTASDRAHERFAQVAMVEGDLRLARVEAERVRDEATREPLLEEVATAERRARARARQRSFAVVGCVVLGVALGTLGARHLRAQEVAKAEVERANVALERQVARAQAARTDAEDLLAFMLGDLRPRLEPIGRLPLLADVGDRALRYFDRQADGDLTERSRLRKAHALVQIARVQLGQGRVAEAEETLARALAAFGKQRTEASPAADDGGERLVVLTDALLSLAALHLQSGALDRADEALARARDACAEGLAAGALPRDLRGRLVETMSRQGSVALARGDLDAALEAFGEALALLDALVAAAPDELEWVHARGETLGQLGYVYRLQGRLPEAGATLVRAVEEVARAVARAPGHVVWRSNLAFLQDRLGGALLAAGRQRDALAAHEANAATMRSLVAHDPSNTTWRLGLAVSLNRVAAIRDQLGDAATARRLHEESMALARGILEHDERNTAASTHLAWTLTLLGRLAMGQGNDAEAARCIEESLALREALVALDPANRWWHSDVAQGVLLRGELALRRGAVLEAFADFDRAADEWEALLLVDPENEYWRNGQARARWGMARAARLAGDEDAAAALVARGLDVVRPMAERSRDSTHLTTLALLLREAGEHDAAREIAALLRERGVRDPWLDDATE